MIGLNLSLRLMNTKIPRYSSFVADFGTLAGMCGAGDYWAGPSRRETSLGDATKVFIDVDERKTVSLTIGIQELGASPSKIYYSLNYSQPITYSSPFIVTYGDILSVGVEVPVTPLEGSGIVTVDGLNDSIPWVINR